MDRKNLKVAFVAVLVGFLLGFGPMYMRLQQAEKSGEVTQSRLEAEVKVLGSQLKMSQLHSQLGMLLMEVEQKNFGTAKQQSTEFFNRLEDVATEQHANEVGQMLEGIIQSRDEITAGLATADGEVESTLRNLYEELAAPAGAI